jgi:putative ATP-dependent endonuclease of OLD family
MPRIRRLEIENFRCVRRLNWVPRPGLNGLVGPGDIGKSTVLDAIDYCLGARRSLTFTDADFHGLNETRPIRIEATIGELPDALLDLDTYGLYLRGFDPATGVVVDEPGVGIETVLTVVLTVDQSLEPMWTLHSDRAAASDQQRGLPWALRGRLAPTRLGPGAGYHFAWRQGSLLSRLTDDLPDASSSLATAARQARRAFGEQTAPGLEATLESITAQATRLGVNVGDGLRAMLDAESVALGRGTIALHMSDGVPLQCLGAGSVRLLAAGMQRAMDGGPSMLLADEIEHGLEPHRICRLLDALGAKDETPSSQVFLTTHSPVAIREMSGDALFVLRRNAEGEHTCIHVGDSDEVQGTARAYPEALLSRVVVVCEGASEVGLMRGLDQYEDTCERATLASVGVAYIDGGGESKVVARARALQSLGFSTSILRDSDLPAAPVGEGEYLDRGGRVFTWQTGQALEDALFADLPSAAVNRLLDLAVDKVTEQTVDAQIRSKSANAFGLDECRAELTIERRRAVGAAAKSKHGAWFKSVSDMEVAARDVIGPVLEQSGATLRETVEALRNWARDAVA